MIFPISESDRYDLDSLNDSDLKSMSANCVARASKI